MATNSKDFGVYSHFPVLAAAVIKTVGPVLELGMGWGSTPMLSLMCRSRDRTLVSMETDVKWFNEFANPFSHRRGFVKDWDDVDFVSMTEDPKFGNGKWGVAFIDCSPGEIRKDLAVLLKGHAKFIILHDHEAGPGAAYYYDQIIDQFKYNETYRLLRPHTLILSDDEPFGLSALEQGLT